MPAEAKKVYTEVRGKATEAVNKGMDKIHREEEESTEALDESEMTEALDEIV